MEDLTGRQFGPYQIISALGEGGMAAVYKAYQPAMDRYVALKVLPRHFASDPQFIARFRQEAKIIAKLQHPHILAVHDFGEAEGYTYIVMPFVAGGTLADLLKNQTLSLTQIRDLVSQIGSALDYAHARGLIHRDVKPSNILIDESGNCLLTDFGLAKMVEGAAALTASGAVLGTPAYMSPEQGMGQELDKRSDIYSLGVVLYEMVTGRTPYRAETPMAVIFKHINDPLPPPRTIQPTIPESVERVILKALAKNPQDRYATADKLVRALQSAIQDTPSTNASIPDKAAVTRTEIFASADSASVPPAKGRGLKWIGLAGGVIVAAVLIVLAIMYGRNPPVADTNISTGTLTTTQCPSTIEIGLLMLCDVTSAGTSSFFTLETTQGSIYYLEAQAEQPGLEGLSVEIVDSSANTVSPSYFESTQMVFTATVGGSYIVKITGGGLGKYALFVQDLSTLANVRTLQVLQPIDGSIQTQLQHDAYTFDAVAADPVRIEVQVPPESLLSLQMIVLSPKGEKVAEGYSHGGVSAQFTATVTGIYLMVVKSGETEEPSTGTYTIVRYK